MSYIPRHIEPRLKELIKQFPVLTLTGPRQAGKSTLLEHLFAKEPWQYISLDQRSVLQRISKDPDLFIKDIHQHTVIDEAQKIPDLFHVVKWHADQKSPYKIVLSGSANFLLLKEITESLSGRTAITELYPLTFAERHKKKPILLSILNVSNTQELQAILKQQKPIADKDIIKHIFWGGFPKIHTLTQESARINWFESYLTSYIERDVRTLAQIADLNDFQKVYQLLTYQTGQILNLSNIANDSGLSVNTCKKYLNILISSYHHLLLPPFFVNIGKRLIKLPKIYTTDTGLANHLTQQESIDAMLSSGRWGYILETAIIGEFFKQNTLLSSKARFSFWRTSNGAEVDLIVEGNGSIIPIEIKNSNQINKQEIRGLRDFLTIKSSKKIPFGIILYRGTDIYHVDTNILAIPITYV